MSTRIGALVFSTLFALGCATGSHESKRRKLDYCDCEMWGVTGVDPGPDYRPSPRPPVCERILKQPHEGRCPIPP